MGFNPNRKHVKRTSDYLIVGSALLVVVLLVVCEVKARASNAFGTPAEAVTPSKQLKVRRATADFRASLRESNDPLASLVKTIRFDVACVLGTQLEMLQDIF